MQKISKDDPPGDDKLAHGDLLVQGEIKKQKNPIWKPWWQCTCLLLSLRFSINFDKRSPKQITNVKKGLIRRQIGPQLASHGDIVLPFVNHKVKCDLEEERALVLDNHGHDGLHHADFIVQVEHWGDQITNFYLFGLP